MRLVRYNPLSTPSFFRNAFEDFFTDPVCTTGENTPWQPAVDILNKEDSIELAIELPGLKKEDIAVNIEDKVLTISGERIIDKEDNTDKYYRRERHWGSFKRSFTLSDDIVTDEVTAEYNNGILRVTLKKETQKEAVKQITVN